ncbi:hypothetical protein EJB05_48094, partial [Eragrostis curvula]
MQNWACPREAHVAKCGLAHLSKQGRNRVLGKITNKGQGIARPRSFSTNSAAQEQQSRLPVPRPRPQIGGTRAKPLLPCRPPLPKPQPPSSAASQPARFRALLPSPGAMGEKRARAEEPDEPPRKAPRLDSLLTAAAAASDSGRGEAAAAPVVSNPREEGAKGTSDNRQCNHAPADSAQMEVVRSSLFSERAGMCELCKHPFVGSSILMCLECGRHFCSGVGSVEYPHGHSRLHAREKQHWVSVLSENPESAFCFKCDCVVDAPCGTIIGLLTAADPEEYGGNEPCNHVPSDDAHMEMYRSSLASEHGGKCAHCKTFRESSILVCLECGLHLCTGFGSAESRPSGHSRLHAKQKQHWVAAMFDEPESAYCFKCKYVVSISVPPDDVEMDNFEAGGHAPKLPDGAVNFITDFSSACRAAYLRCYAIRGIPNMGDTCYLNAVVQCLLVLDKLRERMLAPDAPNGLYAIALKDLFAGTSGAKDLLDPEKLLTCVGLYTDQFPRFTMHDSHTLFVSLRNGLDEEEEIKNRTEQKDAPTVIKSIFRFRVSEKMTCGCLSYSVSNHVDFFDISLPLPSKDHPAKSAASQRTSENIKSLPMQVATQFFPANEQSKSKKIQTGAESGDSHLLGSELKDVAVEETPEPFEVDSTEVQSKNVVHGRLQTQEDKVACPKLSQRITKVPVNSNVNVEEMNDTTANSVVSIEDCLSLFFEQVLAGWRCDKCDEIYKALSTNQSENGNQIAASMKKTTTVDGDQAEQSDRTTTVGGDSIQTYCFITLPPVLALHIKRSMKDETSKREFKAYKVSDHVGYKEYLDVKPFMDPSSVDKDNCMYRLVGVVEHIGTESVESGHYVAYVRARKIGDPQQQGSCSHSWFCANDREISEVTLEDVLKREAYILFYERMEG